MSGACCQIEQGSAGVRMILVVSGDAQRFSSGSLTCLTAFHLLNPNLPVCLMPLKNLELNPFCIVLPPHLMLSFASCCPPLATCSMRCLHSFTSKGELDV